MWSSVRYCLLDVIKYLIQYLGNIFHYQVTTLHSCEENTNYNIMYALQYLFAHMCICTDRCIHVPLTCVCVTGPLECPKVSTMLSNISFQEAICLHHYCYSISSDTSPQSGNLIIDGILFIHVNLPVYVLPYKSDYSRVFGSLALAAACWLDVVIMSGVKFFDLLYIHSGTNNLPLAGNDWMMERSTQKTDTLSSSIFTRRTLTIWSLSNFFFLHDFFFILFIPYRCYDV